MTTTNISKAHTENNRMSGYREAGGREEGREEGRGRTEEREGEGGGGEREEGGRDHEMGKVYMDS